MGYDPLRSSVFPKEFTSHEQCKRVGRLTVFMINEVRDNPVDKKTPTDLLNLRSIEHLLHINFPTITELVEQEVVVERSYGRAYEEMGLYDDYSEDLRRRSLIDDPVFQVTPKGNTLIFLTKDSGDKTPKEKRAESPAWVPQLAPTIA